MTSRWSDIVERLSKCEGPDRELDEVLLRACGWTVKAVRGLAFLHHVWIPPDGGKPVDEMDIPRPTESLDAALLLVPEDWDELRFIRHKKYASSFGCFLNGDDTIGATPSLALCIAACRARQHRRAAGPSAPPTSATVEG